MKEAYLQLKKLVGGEEKLKRKMMPMLIQYKSLKSQLKNFQMMNDKEFVIALVDSNDAIVAIYHNEDVFFIDEFKDDYVQGYDKEELVALKPIIEKTMIVKSELCKFKVLKKRDLYMTLINSLYQKISDDKSILKELERLKEMTLKNYTPKPQLSSEELSTLVKNSFESKRSLESVGLLQMDYDKDWKIMITKNKELRKKENIQPDLTCKVYDTEVYLYFIEKI